MSRSRFGAVTSLMTVLLVAGLVFPAAAQQTEPGPEPQPGAEADLALHLSSSGGTPLVGDTLDVTLRVSNSGPEDANEVWIYGSLSDSFAVTRSDDGCSSDPYGGVSCPIGSFGRSDDRTFELQFKRVKAREAWGYFSINSINPDPAYEDNYAELYVEPDTSTPADLSISLDADGDPEVGDRFTYEIDVANDGPEEARDALMVDPIPYGVEVVSFASDDPSDDCTVTEDDPYVVEGEAQPTYKYRELRCDLGTLDPGARTRVELEVERVDPYQLWNSAWVSTSSYDSNYENDYAYISTDADPSVTSDISTEIEEPDSTPLLGESFELTFTAGNDGPAPIGDASLGAFLPDGVVLDGVTSQDEGVECSANQPFGGGGTVEGDLATTQPTEPEPASPPKDDGGRIADPNSPIYYGGQGFNCALGSLADGDSVDVVASLTRVKSRELWMTASAWSSNFDPDYENNYEEAQLAADKSHPADVGVDLSGPDDAEIGEEVEFEIEVTNDGPMDARSVVVTDTLPYGLDYVSSQPSDAGDECSLVDGGPYSMESARDAAPIFWGYRQVRCELGTLEPGESASVDLAATRSSDYELSNSAYVETASYDSNYDNDNDYVTLEGEPAGPCPLQPEGSKSADDISVISCPVEAGAGADNVVLRPESSTRSVRVSAGKGSDSIVVDVPSGSNKARRLKVNAGAGDDIVTIVVAPGATNATVIVDTGPGRDSVTIDAAHLARGVRIVVIGGRGPDSIVPSATTSAVDASWARGFVLWGGPGNDVLTGAYADDKIHGGDGRDMIAGGAGSDTIDGGAGKDVCAGGPGTDVVKRC